MHFLHRVSKMELDLYVSKDDMRCVIFLSSYSLSGKKMRSWQTSTNVENTLSSVQAWSSVELDWSFITI